MKTAHSTEKIHEFLAKQHAVHASIKQLAEGHIAQALYFENAQGDKLVLRIAPKDEDFLRDQYAFEKFGHMLPIPRVREIGAFDDSSFFCISDYVDGEPSNSIKQAVIDTTQDEILSIYAKLFTIDISGTSSYGPLDVTTGDGECTTWRQRLLGEVSHLDVDIFQTHAKNIGINKTLVDKLIHQVKDNLDAAPETRWLIHGDLGFDNMLIRDGKVTALLDWANVGYGDWMYDFSKFNFWWPGRHGDKHKFAATYNLDDKSLEQREALYWATTALGTIRFADTFRNDSTAKWLRQYLGERVVGVKK
jgi:hygromycin-B 4-O-kinase